MKIIGIKGQEGPFQTLGKSAPHPFLLAIRAVLRLDRPLLIFNIIIFFRLAYDMSYYVKLTALSIKAISRSITLFVLQISAV